MGTFGQCDASSASLFPNTSSLSFDFLIRDSQVMLDNFTAFASKSGIIYA
jgi:hypothetical protein